MTLLMMYYDAALRSHSFIHRNSWSNSSVSFASPTVLDAGDKIPWRRRTSKSMFQLCHKCSKRSAQSAVGTQRKGTCSMRAGVRKQALTWQKVRLEILNTRFSCFRIQWGPILAEIMLSKNHPFQAATLLHRFYRLDWSFLIEQSPDIEMVSICTVQYGNMKIFEHLKCD